MKKTTKKHLIMCLIELAALFGLFVFIRQATMWMVYISFDERAIISGIFELRYSKNYGMAFGLFPERTDLLITMQSILCVCMLTCLIVFRKGNIRLRLGLILMLTGAINNLLERIFLGFVEDYFYILVINFNLADIFIVTGAILVYLAVKLHINKIRHRKVHNE